jgi:DNA polymerase I-like protein with 3'-5' exonuclease and polymerase domains
MARLNVQGLARRDAGLMSCIGAEPGRTLVSIDLSAGEPTVTAHYSRDPNYCYATFDGVGQRPFYRDGILMIDDIYVMCMSVSPIGAQIIRDMFEQQLFDGRSFADQWVTDSDVIKSAIKVQRNLHKMLALALGYGMGPKKMVKQCKDSGYDLDIKTAEKFYAAYWSLFAGVRRLADQLAYRIKRDGHIVNAFGYRLTPPPHKAFNYLIQSSVSGIMHVYNAKLFALAPYANFVTVIHDELLCDVPTDMLDQFRIDRQAACDSLNADLNWTTKVRVGFAYGTNWYEAK